MTWVEFGPSLLPELREILLSTGNAYSYGPDGELADVRKEPFLGAWRLRSLTYDDERGKSRVVCVLTAEGKEVTATIDASDFPRLHRNTTRTTAWNGSTHYHDLAVKASVLIEEQIITKEPATVPNQVRIQDPSDRIRRSLPTAPADCPQRGPATCSLACCLFNHQPVRRTRVCRSGECSSASRVPATAGAACHLPARSAAAQRITSAGMCRWTKPSLRGVSVLFFRHR